MPWQELQPKIWSLLAFLGFLSVERLTERLYLQLMSGNKESKAFFTGLACSYALIRVSWRKAVGSAGWERRTCQPLGSLCHNQPLWEALLEHLKIGTDCRALDNGLPLFKYLIRKLIGTSDNFNPLLNALCNIFLQQPVVEMIDADFGVGARWVESIGEKK